MIGSPRGTLDHRGSHGEIDTDYIDNTTFLPFTLRGSQSETKSIMFWSGRDVRATRVETQASRSLCLSQESVFIFIFVGYASGLNSFRLDSLYGLLCSREQCGRRDTLLWRSSLRAAVV